MNILILGLPGSGKTTLATKLSKKLGYEVVSFDTYRYGENWHKKDFDEFRTSVLSALNLSTKPKIIETVYTDSDPVKARMRVVKELYPIFDKIYIIKPEPIEVVAAQLIDRCIERAILLDKGLPAVKERSQDRAWLLITNITMYEENVRTLLQDFDTDPKVVLLRRDDLTDYLGL